MNTRGIVALILAVTLPLFIVGAFFVRLAGMEPVSEAIISWKEIMFAIVGGLIGYIGGSSKGDNDT